jgi:hypothetical protein
MTNVVALVGFSLLCTLAGCASETDDGTGKDEAALEQFEVAVEADGKQGGCSNAEIREAQAACGGAIHGCWKSSCTPGGDICGGAGYFYQCAR